MESIEAHHTITGEALAQAAADFCRCTCQDSKVREMVTEASGRTLYTIKIPFTSHIVIFWGAYGANSAGCGIFDGDRPYTDMWDIRPIHTVDEFVHDILESKFPTRMNNLQARALEFKFNEKIMQITEILHSLQTQIGER